MNTDTTASPLVYWEGLCKMNTDTTADAAEGDIPWLAEAAAGEPDVFEMPFGNRKDADAEAGVMIPESTISTCDHCHKTFERPRFGTACAVIHLTDACCHYGEREILLPADPTPEGDKP